MVRPAGPAPERESAPATRAPAARLRRPPARWSGGRAAGADLGDPALPELVAETDVLAYYSFPVEHRRQIWSTNSLERLNREVGRRCEDITESDFDGQEAPR